MNDINEEQLPESVPEPEPEPEDIIEESMENIVANPRIVELESLITSINSKLSDLKSVEQEYIQKVSQTKNKIIKRRYENNLKSTTEEIEANEKKLLEYQTELESLTN
eukprot:TRINITY_DN6648_c0_g1_i1.p1 TRINITY_DN6648_c0_g1~~TRINITY_DN6648_c0_g1_i1.p1  ORF type:complete len:108 (-),score=45.06 TRINITY_DN6648_c0_g1_i1:122-445(-)